MKQLISLILLCLIFIFSECEIQQRRYRSGFYFNGHSKSVENFKSNPKQHDRNNAQGFNLVQEFPAKIVPPPDTCDIVEFTDGTKIKLRIIDANERELKYVFCDGDDNPRRVSRKQVLSIWYADGRKEGVAATMPTIVPKPTPVTQPATPSVSAVVNDSLAPKTVVDSTKTTIAVSTTSVACDKITLRNGDEIQAKIIEVGIKDLRYKLCDMLDGPVFIQPKKDVFMVAYSNGYKDVFKQEAEDNTMQQSYQQETVKPKNGLAVWAFICSLLGVFPVYIVGGVAAVILGMIYLNKNSMQPEIYDHPKMARFAVILGAITASLYILLFVFS